MYHSPIHLEPGTVQDLIQSPISYQPFPDIDPTGSIHSVPALVDQSSPWTCEPGIRFIQDWGGTHIGFLVP